MPALSFAPAFAFLSAFGRGSPAQPLRTLIRTTGYKLRPPRPVPHAPRVRSAQNAVLRAGTAGPHQLATLLCERRKGSVPTIVLGGFVPDSTEQVFLLRGSLLQQGSVFYFNYPRHGFSTELLFAQLDDLVQELATIHGTPPVIFSVSFGAGLVLEWLRRARDTDRRLPLRGTIFVSPVACIEDLLDPAAPKASTLLGRAIKPYLDARGVDLDPRQVEKSRTIFTRMFEAGAQNKAALALLMTPDELRRLHGAVMDTIGRIDSRGARERIDALRAFVSPADQLAQGCPPLSEAPALVLFAEAEGTVLDARSPSLAVFNTRLDAFFPRGECRTLANPAGAPVQHASLIFHCAQFTPPITRFYRGLKAGKLPLAA